MILLSAGIAPSSIFSATVKKLHPGGDPTRMQLFMFYFQQLYQPMPWYSQPAAIRFIISSSLKVK